MVLSCCICSRNQWERVVSSETSGDRKSFGVYLLVEKFSAGSERLVDAVRFSGGTGSCRAALRWSGASGDHTVAQRGHGWICADPLYDAGQTVQTGNEWSFTAAGIWNDETGKTLTVWISNKKSETRCWRSETDHLQSGCCKSRHCFHSWSNMARWSPSGIKQIRWFILWKHLFLTHNFCHFIVSL